MIAFIHRSTPFLGIRSLRFVSPLVILAVAFFTAAQSSTAAIYTNVDSSFNFTGGILGSVSTTTNYSITATNTTATNFGNVYYMVPFAYQVNGSFNYVSTYNWQTSSSWINGSGSLGTIGGILSIPGVGSALMSNSNLPLSDPTPPPGIGANPVATVLGSNSVPLIFMGNFGPTGLGNDVHTFTFSVNSAVGATPTAIAQRFTGFAVTPEPGTFVMLACGLAGLLFVGRRRRRAMA